MFEIYYRKDYKTGGAILKNFCDDIYNDNFFRMFCQAVMVYHP